MRVQGFQRSSRDVWQQGVHAEVRWETFCKTVRFVLCKARQTQFDARISFFKLGRTQSELLKWCILVTVHARCVSRRSSLLDDHTVAWFSSISLGMWAFSLDHVGHLHTFKGISLFPEKGCTILSRCARRKVPCVGGGSFQFVFEHGIWRRIFLGLLLRSATPGRTYMVSLPFEKIYSSFSGT